jgi:hypothetical protein
VYNLEPIVTSVWSRRISVVSCSYSNTVCVDAVAGVTYSWALQDMLHYSSPKYILLVFFGPICFSFFFSSWPPKSTTNYQILSFSVSFYKNRFDKNHPKLTQTHNRSSHYKSKNPSLSRSWTLWTSSSSSARNLNDTHILSTAKFSLHPDSHKSW